VRCGRPVALLIALALLVPACETDEPGPPDRANPQPTPFAEVTPGGTVRVGMLGEPPTLDPYGRRATSATWAAVRPLYRSLFRIRPDRSIAEDLVASMREVRTGVELTLREATWSDGDPIDATDVVRSVRRARLPSGFAGLRARRQGDGTVELRGRSDDWRKRLAQVTFVLPRGRAGGKFSGPFVLARRTPGLKIVLEPNGTWTGDEPSLDRIEVRYVTSLRTLIELIAAERLEAAWLPSAVNLGQRLDERGIEYSSALGDEVVYLDPTAADLTRRERAWIDRTIDLEHLEEGLIRDDGQVAESRNLDARPQKPDETVRLTVPAGDELLALLAQNLQVQLGPNDPVVEIAVADPAVVYGGGDGDPGGVKLIRGFGEPGPGTIPMFDVATFVAFGANVVGVEANPTLEGPLWNAESWGLAR
jgi:hypothetical protein